MLGAEKKEREKKREEDQQWFQEELQKVEEERRSFEGEMRREAAVTNEKVGIMSYVAASVVVFGTIFYLGSAMASNTGDARKGCCP